MPAPIPPQTRQYQIWAKPVATIAEVITLAGWLQPLALPPAHLVEPGLGAAWTQYHTGFTVPAATTVSLDWATPLSEPVRQKQGLHASQQQFFTIQPLICEPSVATNIGGNSAGAVASYTISTALAPVPAGALICVGVTDFGGIASTRVSDSAGNLYSKTLSRSNTALFYTWNCLPLSAAGSITITKANSVNTSLATAFYATGIQKTSDPHDSAVDATNTGAATASPTVTSKVPTKTGELFVTWLEWVNDGSPTSVTQPTGWAFPFNAIEVATFDLVGGTRVAATASAQTWTPSVGIMASPYTAAITAFASSCDPIPPSIGWLQSLAEPVRVKSRVREGEYETDWKPTAAAVTYVPSALSEPVRIEPGLSASWTQYHTGFLAVPVPSSATWFEAFSEPVRSKPPFHVSQQQFLAVDAKWTPASLLGGWWKPFSEPVRSKPSAVRDQPFTTDWKWTAPTPTQPYFWNALSEPVRVEPGLSAAWTQYHTGFTVPATTTTAYNWFSPLSEPVMQEGGLGAQYQQVSTVGTGTLTVYVFPPFDEPVRVKVSLHAARQQAIAFVAPAAITDLRNYWYQPLSEPVRSKKAIAWQQFFASNTNYIYADSWWRPLADPVRTKPRTAWYEPFTTDWQWTALSLVGQWLQPFSEPVRSKKAVPWQQFFTTDLSLLTDLRVYWYRPLSEPVRVKPAVAWQQFFVTDPTTPSTVTDLRNFWYQPWAEPVRFKQSVTWQQFFTTDPTTPTAVTDLRNFWFQPWSEPVRSKKAVPWQQSFVVDPIPVITDLRNYWYQPLAEPVRSKKSVPWQQFYTAEPLGSDLRTFWYVPLAEPVRFKKSVPWQQPWAMDWKWSPPSGQVFAGWYGWLGEPVRQRQGLHAARQQFFTTDWKWSPPTASLLPGWHRWLAEPVRQKQGIHASRAPFFQMDWKWQPPIQANITYTLDATEQGDSARLFYASMDIVIGAYVTITEEEVGNMAIVTITARSE